MGLTSFGPPSPNAQTRTTLIPACAAWRNVSGICARSSSRYITATFAPTKRKGRLPTKKRPPRCRTNALAGEFVATFGEATKKRTAALASNTSAATAISFLLIKPLKSEPLIRVCQADETHNCADRAKHYKQ